MTADRPLCILIGALGGQGGGVLADWLVEASYNAGYPAQATSTPGVAQRTGATTYYFELFPEKNPPMDPVFTLFPATGDLDIMAALEPTEAGRALERGFVTETTTVITGLDRVYSTAEKMSAGDGTIDGKPMMESLEKAAKDVICLDVSNLAGSSASRINSVMFGAIIGSGILPLSEKHGRAAIQEKGVAVESNLTGYKTGLQAARDGGSAILEEPDRPLKPAPVSFNERLETYPEAIKATVAHGIAKLVDYQDAAYADLYLDRLNLVRALDTEPTLVLTREVAQRMALWMTFEDVVRVAQLKTRPGRLARIRGELGVSEDTPLRLTDYFKPGRDEIIGMLPPSLSWLLPRIKKLERGNGLALHIPTGSAFGFALLKILASLKFLRRRSAQYLEEQAYMLEWLEAVKAAAALDYELACQTARLSIWARGYGAVRRGGHEKLAAIFTDWSTKLEAGVDKVAADVDQSLLLAHANPDATH